MREEGLAKGREEVRKLIQNMFLNGISIEQIAVITKKSAAELDMILKTTI